jgi:hypothetical protein
LQFFELKRAHHDNSWSTEATLATVANRDPLLNCVGILHVAKSFHRNDMLSVNTNQGGDARVHGGMVDLICRGVEVGNDLMSQRKLELAR